MNWIESHSENEPEYGSPDKFVWYTATEVLPLVEYIKYLELRIELIEEYA